MTPLVKDYVSENVLSLVKFIDELECCEDVDTLTLQKIADSNITTENNEQFRKLIKRWERGHYDDSPEKFKEELIKLVNGNS